MKLVHVGGDIHLLSRYIEVISAGSSLLDYFTNMRKLPAWKVEFYLRPE